jgi:hypothetical protein
LSILDRMHFRALDSDFNATAVVDAYDSMIWSERYNDVGDFEVHGPNSSVLRAIMEDSTYIFNSVTSTLMVIEKSDVEYSEEDGSTITLSGRSMGSVLDRRVMLTSTTILNPADRRFSEILCGLVSDAFGDTIANRHWDKLLIHNDTSVDSVKLPVDIPMEIAIGDSLLTVVTDITMSCGLGFTFEFNPTDKTVTFRVYEGVNRATPGENLILFSDLYDNLLTAKEAVSKGSIKNAALVIGSADDPTTELPKLPQIISDNNFVGIDRREAFFRLEQADTVYLTPTTQRAMSNNEYIAALLQGGANELQKIDYKVYREYDGEIVETEMCKYGTHYSLGDLVAFRLPDLQHTTVRLEGITFSDDGNTGKTLAPKFNYNV